MFRSYERYVVNSKYCVLRRHQTTLKRFELCSTRTLNEVVDRFMSNDSSSSHLIRLFFVCCRPALLSSTTSSVVFVRAWSVYPVVVRQRLVRNWSVSAAVAVETVVRPARPSSRTPSADVAVDLLASSGTSNLVIFVVVVFYVGAASSRRSSSTTTPHPTTLSTTSVLRRRLRPYPLYASRAHARRLATYVCKL